MRKISKRTPRTFLLKKIKKKEIKEYIMHHLQDSYDFSLFSYTNDAGEHVYLEFPLPVIIWDDGLKDFFFFQIPPRRHSC